MSEKLDGVRGYWTGKEMISRSGNPFSVPTWFTKNFPSTPLDGELWIDRRKFSVLVGIIRRKIPAAEWEKVRYLIFDAPQAEGGFEMRLDFARRWFRQHPNPYTKVLKQQICENELHLRRKLGEIESLGGEGLMLRKPNSPYTVGRSYDLLKVKTYKDQEAKVIKHLAGSGKMQGALGHCWLNCRMEFNLQLEPALQIRSAKIPLLWEASLPLSIMDFTNRVFPGLPPFSGFGRRFNI